MRGKLLGRSTIKALKRIILMHESDRFPRRWSLMDGQSIVGHIRSDLDASHTDQDQNESWQLLKKLR